MHTGAVSARVVRTVGLSLDETWARLTDFRRHTDHVPLTDVRPDPGPPSVGWRFVARTSLGPVHIDDVMRLTRWEPPRDGRAAFALSKEGRALKGWAVVELVRRGSGCRVEWTEEIRPPVGSIAPVAYVADRLTAWLFGRVVERLTA